MRSLQVISAKYKSGLDPHPLPPSQFIFNVFPKQSKCETSSKAAQSDLNRVFSGMPFIPIKRYTVNDYARFPVLPLNTAWNTDNRGENHYKYTGIKCYYTVHTDIQYSYTVGNPKPRYFWFTYIL